MSFPVWSGINAEQINSTEVNGCAPTPLVQTDGFSSAIFPVLMGAYPGQYSDVMHVRPEQRAMRVIDETRDIIISDEHRAMNVLPEDRTISVARSRKRYP